MITKTKFIKEVTPSEVYKKYSEWLESIQKVEIEFNVISTSFAEIKDNYVLVITYKIGK